MAERSNNSKIPAWVLEEIETWLADGQSGELHLIGRAGVIKHIKREDLILPPQVPGKGGAVLCPACGEPMESRDYGNLQVCRCGLKRTRSQLARPGEKKV